MNVNHLLSRTAAVVLPAALVLGATGTALAAKPPRTPKPVVSSQPDKVTNSRTATFVWTVSDPATVQTCSLDGGAYTTCASPTTYPNLTDKAHTFALRARLGNGKPATYSYGWTVDTVAPLAPIVSPIAGPTSNRSAAVSFSDSDASVAGFTCALDGGTAAACTSPQPYSALADGLHTVVVTAQDAAGNTASSSVSWTVDATAPNIPVVSGPTSPTKNPVPVVTFSGEPGATFTCSLNGAPAEACNDGTWTHAALVDGSYTLTVTPTDAANNVGTPGTATWVVDTVAPSAPSLVSAPAATTNDPGFTVRVSDTDLSTAGYLCTFEGSTAPCTSTWTVDPSFVPSNKGYSLTVVARDLAGNTSDPLSVSWTFDSTAPSPAAFLSGPANPTNVVNPTFDFVDTDTTTDHFTCAFDTNAVLDPCLPGVALSALPGGGSVSQSVTHAVSVWAVDGVGNVSAPVLWHWVLDTTAPASQPNVGQGGVTPGNQGSVNSPPTFVFGSNDPAVAGFVCQVVSGTGAPSASAWTPCASGYTPALPDGTYTFYVATVDQAGNIGTPISFTWTLDTKAPVGSIVFPTNLSGVVRVNFAEPVLGVTTSTARLLLAGTTTGVATTQTCRNAANAVVSCAAAGGVRAVVLAHSALLVAGQKYTVKVTSAVHDLAGNAGSAPTTVYRAQRLLQESEAAIGQTWVTRTSTSSYGGRYLLSHLPYASVAYPFRGTSITWYTTTGPAMGTANVYCGSTFKTKVNNYASSTHWRVARTVKCSSTTANNVLRVVATGAKGTTLAKGTDVVVDAVKVGATLTTNPVVTQRWGTASSSLASLGRYAVADRSGEVFALTFRGTSITWRTLLGKNMGKAKVYVDGVYKGTFDQFATTSKAYSRTWKLTDKVHTIKVVVTGTRRSGATGSRVVLDSLTVG